MQGLQGSWAGIRRRFDAAGSMTGGMACRSRGFDTGLSKIHAGITSAPAACG
jgi:hypothetical protein